LALDGAVTRIEIPTAANSTGSSHVCEDAIVNAWTPNISGAFLD